MKKITIIILLTISYSFLMAQGQKNDANITGHVIDAKTKEHLPYIRIGIKGTTIGTLTDASGHFFLKHLPEGDFTVVASSVGYSTSEQPVRIERGKTIDISIELSEQAISLSEVVVTSDRNETNKQESSSIVNVLSTKTFDLTASNNLAQVLNFQTGLRVENTCQNCGVPQLRINGLEGQYSQILLDSRPVFSSLAAVYGLEQLPLSMIERVEIIRGGGSALFGSNAIGGVVNIITKEPLRNTLTISNQSNWVGGKSYDINTSLNGAFVSDNSKAGVYIFAMIRNRQQYDRDGDGFTEIPKLNSEMIGFRGYYKTSNYSKLTLEYHHISEYRRGGNHLELPPDRVDIAEQLQHAIDGGGLIFDLFSKNYKHKFSFYTSLQNIDRKSYFGTNQDPNAYGKTNDVTIIGGSQYRYSMKKCLFLPADLTVGVEYNYNSLKDEMLGYHRVTLQNVHILGAYAQNEWKSKKVNFLIGARLDKHNFIKNPVFSPRVNVRYTPVDLIGLRLSYSSGFRAPQAYEEDLHVGAVGGDVMLISLDPDLKPEKSNSVSFSADFNKTFGQWETNFLIEGFFTDINNVFTLVEQGRDADGNLLMQRQNASGARVYGVNAEIKVVYGRKLTMQVGYTYQQSRYKEDFAWSENPDLEPQRKMFRSPDSYGFMTINYTPFKNFDIAFSGNYSGSMLVQHYAGYIPEDAETVTKSFWDMGLKLSYDIPLSDRTKLQVSIGIKNMLDSFQPDIDKGSLRDAGYIYGPALPRTGYVGVKFSM